MTGATWLATLGAKGDLALTDDRCPLCGTSFRDDSEGADARCDHEAGVYRAFIWWYIRQRERTLDAETYAPAD